MAVEKGLDFRELAVDKKGFSFGLGTGADRGLNGCCGGSCGRLEAPLIICSSAATEESRDLRLFSKELPDWTIKVFPL